jgi:hypothetical protein
MGRNIGVICLILCGFFFGAGVAEANLTAQSSSGTVEVLPAGQQTWEALTASMKLNVGDQVRTGPNSVVDLWFDDGSVLNLAEGTQLSITELNISTAQKTRVARFKLWWGTVTVKVTKLAFTENVCEIETDNVLASVAFAEMIVKYPQNAPQSEIVAQQGQVTVRRIASDDRAVNLVGNLTDQEGIEFLLPPMVGTEVFLSVQKILGTIEVQSSLTVPDILPLFNAFNSFLKIDNEGQQEVAIKIRDNISILGPNTSATVGIPSGQEMRVDPTGETSLVFSIKRRTAAILCEGLYIFLNGGDLSVNDEAVQPGVPNCFPLVLAAEAGQPRSRTLGQEPLSAAPATGEVPVIPNAPQSREPQTTEVADTPTPMPTPTPTPEEEEEEEEVEPTPTPTKTPRPDPTRTPRPAPACPACPPPPPTATPASPILP